MRRALRLWMAVGLLLGLVPLTPLSVAADDAVVGTGSLASCTEVAFDAALATAQTNGGGTITFNCGGPATIDFTGFKTIAAPNVVVIDGANLITFDGQDATHFFYVAPGATLDLRNLTLQNGRNSLSSTGGALDNDGLLSVSGSTLQDNTTGDFGAGGAIYSSESGSIEIESSTFIGNSSDIGGAIYSAENGLASIAGSHFEGNSAFDGGAIENYVEMDIAQSTFVGNSAEDDGGAIENFGMLDVRTSTFEGNTAVFGSGAIYNGVGGTARVESSTFVGNTAETVGGGVTFNRGTLEIISSTLTGNSSDVNGGALYNGNDGTLDVIGSTLSGNTADEDGGGIYNFSGAVTITNSTLTGNSATNDDGGAIFNFTGNPVTITSSTLTGNSAGGVGEAIYNRGQTMIAASIVALNDGPAGASCFNAQGAITSLGSNISNNGSCPFDEAGDIQPSDNVDLGPLADNGGPTQTMLPAATSDAIDAANCGLAASTDQRGYARPSGASCDIGSVEVRQAATYPLCASYYTGAVTSPLYGGCGPGTTALTVPGNLSFCINGWTGQITYPFGQPCTPPRWTHTLPDSGDLLTCVNFYSGANRWVLNHGQCTAYELPNAIPATP